MRNTIPAGINLQQEKLTRREFTQEKAQAYTESGEDKENALKYDKDRLYETRQRRLLQVLQTRFDGSQTKLADAIGRTSAYVSFLLTDRKLPHHKNLGENLARLIEEKLTLPKGWLDGDDNLEVDQARKVEAFPDGATLEGFTLVKRRTVSLSAGNGSIAYIEEKAPPLAFRQEWLAKENLKADKLVIAYAKGDSMTPRIHDGDTLMIDTSQTVLRDGQIYALRIEDELRVKRIYKRTASIIIKSDNEKYPEEVIPLDQAKELHVIGRVVWVSGTL